SDNIRPALYGADYHAEIVGRESTAAPVLSRVVGKHCESGDVVVHEVMLPGDVQAGDLLAVAATGAYGRSMASNYNGLTRPPVVAVADGASRVVVRRETLEDLLGRDLGCRRRRRPRAAAPPPRAPHAGRWGRRPPGVAILSHVLPVLDQGGFVPAAADLPTVPASSGPSQSEVRPLRVALLGCGVVGTEVARGLLENSTELAARAGAPLEVVGIAVRDASRQREGIPAGLLTEDAEGLVAEADVVVELMGGIEPARTLILRALAQGASVVTANKQLLAEQGPVLFEAADAARADLSFEAAVAGAIPIVRPVRESLAGDQVQRVLGIVNGTTNYVLDEMTTQGLDLEDV